MRQEEQQLNNDHPEAVRAAPVTVPPTDDDRDVADDIDEPTDRDRLETDADRPGDDADRTDFHQPGPVPTTFGATTVGGAVAASALASARPEDEPDPREERTARPGDGAVEGAREGWRADPTAEFDRTDRDLADENAGGTGVAGYGSASPTMVDPDAQPTDDVAPAVAEAVPVGAATLFDEPTAQRFRDRWRDVQLRFVDDPRAAAGEAQSLVDEAMQALSAALTEHKSKLGGWQEAGSTDTEQLRVAVREYRDFLDRVLGR
ncbi:hypothetical protein C1I95_19750 [Micromonospora craterilacus]|uniref:Uncharacterized protein n=1 Tax=Micromonospora craterilacus TaxID=1655439 RepID=A0A2W2EP80_9ACTN|nr:hypothetical protein [Micromonospora craterilacus]PZG15390.1 hypothetical protein C1I95_19750 [Micromonospora craterilacus]